MKRIIRFFFPFSALIFLVALISNCETIRIQSLITPTVTPAPPTLFPTSTITATEKVVWFPPTQTALPLATPTVFPTVDMKPDVGALILDENFSDESLWQTFRSEQGNAVLANNELTLAISEVKSEIASFSLLPWQTDFYLSLDVNLSLCANPQDTYSIFFRTQSMENTYRWRFDCLGRSDFTRIHKGKKYILSDWMLNGQIREGAPQKYTLGILANSANLRFFLNDAFQMEIEDSVLSNGGFGIGASSALGSPITVSFSKMQIYGLNH